MGKFAYFVSLTILTLSALGNVKVTSLVVSSGSVRASLFTRLLSLYVCIFVYNIIYFIEFRELNLLV